MVSLVSTNAKKEEFSYAYVQAVASVAGFSVELKRRIMDNAGVDLSVEVPGVIGKVIYPRFDAQVKCTSSDILHEKYIKFPLPIHNYNKLRHSNSLVPQLLIVVIVPENLVDWINISEQETLVKKCGYWICLQGLPETFNTEKITVSIPRTNLFTPSSLAEIMDKIANDEEL